MARALQNGDPYVGCLPPNAAGRTALHDASAGGHTEVVAALVVAGPPAAALRARDPSGRITYLLAATGYRGGVAAVLGAQRRLRSETIPAGILLTLAGTTDDGGRSTRRPPWGCRHRLRY